MTQTDLPQYDASLFAYRCYWQLDLLGQSVFDFVHPCDQEELRDLLTPRTGQKSAQYFYFFNIFA